MSRTIDNPVVEMGFDNKNFEKNVSTSLSTLDKLKKALNMDSSAKSFDKLDTATKQLNFEKLISVADALQRRFSVFGEVGAVAIQRVTNSMLDLANKTISFLTNGVVQGGIKRAMNLENANFQLLGLLKSEEKVAAIMEDVSWSVDGTAYGLDAAAKAASMFAATGMTAGEEMKRALRGVAGVAAMTNSEYESISMIFTTVAGQGRVMGDQLNQLAARGLNAASTLANYLNKVGITANATEADVRKMVSEGKIDFATFAAAMDDAFGEHAKNANKTFQGAMSNVRAALSRIGADFISPLIVQEGPLVTLLNTVRVKINEIRKSTTPFATEMASSLNLLMTLTSKWVEKLDLRQTIVNVQRTWGGFVNIFKAFGAVLSAIGSAFKDVFPESAESILTKLTLGFGKLTQKMIPSAETCEKITVIFKGFFTLLRDAGEAVITLASGAFEILRKALEKININLLDLPALLSNFLISFKDWTGGVNLFLIPFEALILALKRGKDGIKNLIDKFKELPQVQAILEAFRKVLGPVKDTLIEFGKDCADAISGFVDASNGLEGISFDSIKQLGENLKNILVNAFNSLKDGLLDFPNFLEVIRDKIKDLLGNISGVFSKFWDGIKSMFSAAKDFFTNGNTVAGILLLVFGGSFIKIVKNINDTVMPLINLVPKLLGSVTGVFDELQKAVKAYTQGVKLEKISDAIYKMAKSIGVLVASLVVLSQIEPSKLAAGGTALTLIAGGMAALVAAFAKLDSSKNIDLKGVGTAMLGMGVSILLLAKSLKDIAEMEGSVGQALTTITILVIEMVAAMKILNHNKTILKDGEKADNGTISMLAFAISMKTLIKALKQIADEPLDKMVGALGILTILITEMILMNKFTRKGGWESGVGILAMALGVQVILKAVGKIADMNMEDIAKAELVLLSMTVVLGVMSKALQTKVKDDEGIVESSGGSLLAAAGAMLIIGFAIEKIGNLGVDVILKGMAVVTAISLVFAGIMAATKLAGDNSAKVGVTLLAMSAAIAILAGVIALLGQLDAKTIVKGTAAVSALMAMFALVIASTKLAKDCKATLIIMTVTIGMLAAAIGALAIIGPDKVLPASAALSMVMAMFALMVASTGVAGKAHASVLIMAGVVAELALILGLLAQNVTNVDALIPTAEALSLLMLALTASFVIISNCKDVSVEALVGLAGMAVILVELAGVLWLLQTLEIQPNMEVVAELSLLLMAMTACLAVLSVLNVGIDDAVQGSVGLGTFITIMSAFMAGLGALYELVPGAENFLDKGIEVLVKVGEGLGRFAGAIFEGFLDQIIGGLPGMADNLSLFMQNLQPFLDGARSINPGDLDGVGALAGAIVALSAAQVVDAIKNFLPWVGDMEDFGETLKGFGKAMADYSAEVSGKIDPTAVESSAKAGEILAKLQSTLPRSGGFLEDFLGSKQTLAAFGASLSMFGGYMVDYSNAITKDGGIDPGAVEDSANAAKSLAELQNSLPSTGGTLQTFFGETMDIADFGKSLKKFGECMHDYSVAITKDGGIETDAIEDSAHAAQLLADLQSGLPTVGGRLKEYFGSQQTLANFGVSMEKFGGYLVQYSNKITADGGIKKEAIEDSANAAQMLADLQNTLPAESGTLQKFFGGGTMDLTDFGEDLVAFGNALSTYSATLALGNGVDKDLIQNSVDVTKMLVDLAANLGEKDGWFSEKKTLSDFGTEITNFGAKYEEGMGYLVGINWMQASLAIGSLKSLIEVLKIMGSVDSDTITNFGNMLVNMSQLGIDSFVENFENSYDEITKAIKGFIQAASDAITENQSQLETAMYDAILIMLEGINKTEIDFMSSGRKLMEAFISGLENEKSKAGNTSKEIIKYCLKVINDQKSSFRLAGALLFTNLITGFNDKKEAASNKCKEIMNLCLKEIKDQKQYFKISGEDLFTGLIKGFENKKMPAKDQAVINIELCLSSIKERYNKFNDAGKSLMSAVTAGFESSGNALHTTSKNAISTVCNVLYAYGNDQREFYNVGVHYVNGIVNGLDDRQWYAIAVAKRLAEAIDDAVRRTLIIRSPSRVAYESGSYYGQGFINAILDFVDKAYSAAEDMGNSAKDGLNKTISRVVTSISDKFNLNPIITPEVDATRALATAEEINSLFNGGRSVNLSSRIESDRQYRNQNGISKVPNDATPTSYQFVQNNYSPKALSRIEIYRQTKNQFAAFKEATVRT